MQKVYFISGLGADHRAFRFLNLSFCQPVFIDWIPAKKEETLSDYAIRLRQQIPEKHPIVVGLSLGGMLTTEMAKKDPALQAIILASNKTYLEFPYYLRFFKYVPLYKALPGFALKKMQSLYAYAFGIKEQEKRKLLQEIIADADIDFVKWAITAILHWDNTTIPSNVTHIHGTHDRLLRLKYVHPDVTITGGSHIITFDKSEEISKLLKQLTEKNNPL